MSWILERLDGPLWECVGLALLHFLWQGAAVAALLYVLCAAARLAHGRPRHAASLGALLIMAACPVATFAIVSGGALPVAPVAARPAETAAPPLPSDAVAPAPASLEPAPSEPAPAVAGAAPRTFPSPPSRAGMRRLLPAMVATWLLGTLLFATRLALGAAGTWRWRRGREPLPEPLASTAATLAEAMRLPGFARVFASRRVRQPMTLGLLRPLVVIPLSLVTALPRPMLEAAIAHELAHVRRHDQWVILFQRLVETVLFYHPAVWWVSRRVSVEREMCCDELAAAATGRPLDCAGVLEAVARLGPEPRPPALALGLGPRAGVLTARVRHLLRLPPRPERSGWPAALTVLAAVAVGLVSGGLVTGGGGPLADPDGELRVTVLDAHGQPLAGARLTIEHDFDRYEIATDEAGHHRIDVPERGLTGLTVLAEAPGHASIRKVWLADDGNDRIDLPGTHEMHMPRGAVMGGLVRNADGEPIAGASVRLLVMGSPAYRDAWLWNHTVLSDETGRWTAAVLPPDLESVQIGLFHPDFVSHVEYAHERYDATSDPSIAALRDGSAVMVMTRGLTVSGRVVDASGAPIGGASIRYASLQGRRPYPMTVADEHGRFRFTVADGAMRLLVQARGHAPDLRTITAAQAGDQEIQLEAGRLLCGRVLGPDGGPLAGAWIGVGWRGDTDLDAADHGLLRTSEDGRFTWRSAPPDQVTLDVGRAGFMTSRNVAVVPREEGYAITLVPELIVSGTVRDAESGAPIESFRALTGFIGTGESEMWWNRSQPRELSGGRYRIVFDETAHRHGVLVEAEGYEPLASRELRSDEGRVTHDFELRRVPPDRAGPGGAVVGPGGEPAAGAEILLSHHRGTQIDHGRIRYRDEQIWTETDEHGRFQFPPQDKPWAIALLHEQGYAVPGTDDLAAGAPIVLTPWARVEGRYLIGAEPAAGAPVAINMYYDFHREEPGFSWVADVETDADGRFAFERVPAGLGRAAVWVRQTRGLTGTTQLTVFDTAPGETVRVAMGGRGRPVTGRVVMPEGADSRLVWSYGLNKLSAGPAFPWPVGLEGAARGEWLVRWNASPAATEHHRRSYRETRSYSFVVRDDGMFRIEDVEPGTYELSVEISDPEHEFRRRVDPVGRVTAEVTVPAPDPARPGAPFDTGTHVIELINRPTSASDAPDFEMERPDGTSMRLADFRGRYVLVDFWATWCGPCRKLTPHLRELHETYRDDDRIVMLGVSLDRDRDAWLDYVREQALTWPQGWLGDWAVTDVPSQYGVRGIPAVFLVGPEGRILASGLHQGAAIRSTVDAALGPR